MSLSENIKRYRTERAMTQERLADLLGVSAQAVSKWECNDCYPDGSLLVPLANILGVSLDRLFGNRKVYMSDVSTNIRTLLSATSYEKHFTVARDICWQMQKGLFAGNYDSTYDPQDHQEPTNITNTSYILRDNGFSHVRNQASPFFAVFPEPDGGYGEGIGDGERQRAIFECLGHADTMRAVLFIHSKEQGFTFDETFLAKACDIPVKDMEAIINELIKLRLLQKIRLDINGEARTLYSSLPSHCIIALLIMADELCYNGAYTLQANNRTKPLIK